MSMTRMDVPATLTTREAASPTEMVIEGIAVPLDTPTTICPGYREQIAAGAVNLDATPALFYRHDEPVGVITSLWEQDGNLMMSARVSNTALGRDAYTLAKDGAIKSLSIGFFQREFTDSEDQSGTLRTQTAIDLREVSLVAVPAYDDAAITAVRHKTTPPSTTDQETNMASTSSTIDTDAITRSIADIGDTMDTLNRRLALIEANSPAAPDAVPENRSGGELIKAALAGDESARQALTPLVGRAVTTTTTSDARYNEPTFIKDLTRIFTVLNPIQSLFSTGTLPAEGSTIEFAQLKTSTVSVTKQASEGDALPQGKVETKTMTATISTYGGAATLSRQVIERSRSNILDLHLRSLAMNAAKTLANEFAAFFTTQVNTQKDRAITTTKAASALDWKSLLHMMLDAKFAYEDQALTLDGLLVDRATFEAIAGMTDSSGRPILTLSGTTGTNAIGTVSASGAWADLDGLRVIPQRFTTLQSSAVGAFFNKDALRTYSSGLASLQDTNVLDLTQAFSVYMYAAFAAEIPSGLVPLKMAS